MSSTLPKFLSQLCGKFEVATPGATIEEGQTITDILNGRQIAPEIILRALREYPQICVLQVRIWNDREREEKRILYATNE